MSYRTLRAHFGVFKLAYIALFVFLCLSLGLTLVTVGCLCLVGVTDVDVLLIKGGILLFLLGLAPIGWYRHSLALLQKLAACDFALRIGQYTEAIAHANNAWEHAKFLRPNDPLYGMTLENLTRVARAQGNYDDAESFGKKWVWVSEQAWGPDHPKIIYPIAALAEIYLDIARFAEAKPLLE
jgi:tetratricopeptide (TPR) repeat protein